MNALELFQDCSPTINNSNMWQLKNQTIYMENHFQTLKYKHHWTLESLKEEKQMS